MNIKLKYLLHHVFIIYNTYLMINTNPRIKIVKSHGSYRVIAQEHIQPNTLIIVCQNDYVHHNYDHTSIFKDSALDLVYKMIINKEDQLFPRNDNQWNISKAYIKMMDRAIREIKSSGSYREQQHLKYLLNNVSRHTLIQFYAKFIFNAFSINNGCAINVIAARFNHSCDPNVMFNVNPDSGNIEFISIKMITKGSEICNSYLQNHSGSSMNKKNRQSYLKSHYGFDCICSKCKQDDIISHKYKTVQ